MKNEKIRQATKVVCRQGVFPFPLSDTAITIIHKLVGDNDDALDLILAFDTQPSQTAQQLVESSGFSIDKIEIVAGSLAQKGLIFNQPSSKGIMIYRLMPFMMVGLMEYMFMQELKGTKEEKEFAQLFDTMLQSMREHTQKNYDRVTAQFKKMPPVDRTVPAGKAADQRSPKKIAVDKTIPVPDELILPSQSVEEVINKFDDISVGNCFCRHRRRLMGEECSTKAPLRNCFTFGKSARYTAEQGFATRVSKQEALKIMNEAQEAGLVHKAFHRGSREDSPETSICNCCKDCCDTMNLWRNGTTPLVNTTYYLSVIDTDACTGCGVCTQWCPTEAIEIDDTGKARVNETLCFGCGVCSRFCPEEAIGLQEGLRKVFVLPPRLRS